MSANAIPAKQAAAVSARDALLASTHHLTIHLTILFARRARPIPLPKLRVMPWGTANVGLALMVMMEVTVRPAWQASSKLKRDLPPARNALVASIRMRLQPHVLVCAHHAQAAPTRPLTMLNVVLAQHTRCLMLRVMKCKTANARRATQSPMKTPTPARCAKLAPIKMPLEVRSANSALLARVHRLGAKLWRIASATRALLDPLMVVATCA